MTKAEYDKWQTDMLKTYMAEREREIERNAQVSSQMTGTIWGDNLGSPPPGYGIIARDGKIVAWVPSSGFVKCYND